MLLFFKQIYRAPILSGEKTDTIRPAKRLPRVGSVVQACVGPSRIFARLVITAHEAVQVDQLESTRVGQVAACYSDTSAPMVRLRFAVIPENDAAHNPAQ